MEEQQDTRTDKSLIAWTEGQGLTPANMGEAMKLAEMLAASSFVPAVYKGKPGDIIAAIQMGSEVGLKPMSALQSIAVINGRPSIFGDGYLALITASSVYERHEEEYIGTGAQRKAVCRMWRRGNPQPFVGVFGAAEAVAAGLSGRDTYKQYADRMYMWRARHIAGQAGFSDVTKGLLPAEVAEDYPRTVESRVVEQPRRKRAQEPVVTVEQPETETSSAGAEEPPVETPTTPETQAPPPQATSPAGDLITEPQRKRFWAKCKAAKLTDDQIKAMIGQYGFSSTKDITRAVYDEMCASLDAQAQA